MARRRQYVSTAGVREHDAHVHRLLREDACRRDHGSLRQHSTDHHVVHLAHRWHAGQHSPDVVHSRRALLQVRPDREHHGGGARLQFAHLAPHGRLVSALSTWLASPGREDGGTPGRDGRQHRDRAQLWRRAGGEGSLRRHPGRVAGGARQSSQGSLAFGTDAEHRECGRYLCRGLHRGARRAGRSLHCGRRPAGPDADAELDQHHHAHLSADQPDG